MKRIHYSRYTGDDLGIGAEEFPCDILGPLAYEHDLLAVPMEFRDGAMRAPDGPGLGVELDLAAVRGYLQDVEIVVGGRTIYRTPELVDGEDGS
mgnify:CR=1 FL=1